MFDIGLDATSQMYEMSKYIHNNSNCKLLWASPRMSYDFVLANNANCDIITMSMPLYKKLNLLNKDPKEYSLETVKMFYNDALEANYSF